MGKGGKSRNLALKGIEEEIEDSENEDESENKDEEEVIEDSEDGIRLNGKRWKE